MISASRTDLPLGIARTCYIVTGVSVIAPNAFALKPFLQQSLTECHGLVRIKPPCTLAAVLFEPDEEMRFAGAVASANREVGVARSSVVAVSEEVTLLRLVLPFVTHPAERSRGYARRHPHIPAARCAGQRHQLRALCAVMSVPILRAITESAAVRDDLSEDSDSDSRDLFACSAHSCWIVLRRSVVGEGASHAWVLGC